jgi:unsaturated rhamnogalacturonyl hydrolase
MSSQEILEKVSRSWIQRYRPESQSTDWGQTLAMYGLLSGLRKHSNDRVRDYLRTWTLFHMNEGLYVNYFCGSWSFALLYPEITEEFPEAQLSLQAPAENIYDVIMTKALRNGHGIILHNVDLPNIYIDTVYYSAVLLAKLGPYLGKEWKDEASYQILEHLKILKDGDKPFYIHCQQNLTPQRSQGSWARGNGWVMMTLAEILPLLQGHENYQELYEIFLELSRALASVQTPSGLWRTILDDTDAYEESSASAMYLFALLRAKNRGLISNEFDTTIAQAKSGLASCVDFEGRFTQVSEGTWPGTIDYYKSLKTGEWWWGTGAYLLALSEDL